jgi:hypothetical protein
MFTADQEKAADELARVCRSGGRIGLANWTPTSFVGELFKLIGQYVPPPSGVRSPALWGTQERLSELFANQTRSIEIGRKYFVFRYRSAAHWLETFRSFYGPAQKAFAALDDAKRGWLTADLLTLAERFNHANDGTLVAPSEYLEVVITRR